jgi:hypothetical protein
MLALPTSLSLGGIIFSFGSPSFSTFSFDQTTFTLDPKIENVLDLGRNDLES